LRRNSDHRDGVRVEVRIRLGDDAGMHADRRAIADAVLAAAREHDAAQTDRLARYRNVEPETAELLGVLVRATTAHRVFEIGTSNGYSTIWLADAAEAIGGRVLSVEIASGRSRLAEENLRRCGLEAELRVEDAADTLRTSADTSWDLIFLDAERPAYAGYWPDLLRSLRPGGLLAIDNVLTHPEEVADVRALIEAEATVTTAVVPVGAGVLLAVKDAFSR
jgi:predicted O-methyltransferase YrrM